MRILHTYLLSAVVCTALLPAATRADITGFSDITLNSGPLTAAGTPSVSGGTLTLTSIGTATQPLEYQATSVFGNVKQNIQSFTAQFLYQYTGTVTQIPADGFAFVLQDDPRGPQALGDRGGALGVGAFPIGTGQGTLPGSEITPSLDLDFTLAPSSTDPNGSGIALNEDGLTPQLGGQPSQSVGPVDLLSGDPIAIDLAYNGMALTETLTDTAQPSDTFSTAYAANLPALLGSDTAYVGFTAGTGGGNAGQQISNFQFHAQPAVPEASPAMLFAAAGGLLGIAGWRGGRTARRCRRA